MVKRVDILDENLGNIIEKIENALAKMTTVEKSKQSKMESMNKILDAIIGDGEGCKYKREFFASSKRITIIPFNFFSVSESDLKEKIKSMVKNELHKSDN